MKSILITTGIFAPDIGGPASYAKALATRLSSQGVAVTVVAYSSVARHGDDAALPFRVRRVWTKLPWGLRHALFFLRVVFAARRSDGILTLNAVSAGVPAACVSWLGMKLGKSKEECHIGEFDVATCNNVVSMCDEKWAEYA
jgi:hypothetical protein